MDEQQFEYRTGRTEPRQKHNGLIAFLLILVIFLSGLVSVLGILNIHLFRMLEAQDDTSPLSFAAGDIAPADFDGNALTIGGITLQEQPEMYQQLYDLPAGLYVVDADDDGPVLPGDVLVGFENTAVGSLSELNSIYGTCKPGDRVNLKFYRQGADYYTHTVILEETP